MGINFFVIGCALLSAAFTAWFIPQILVVSFKKKLFDFTDSRKVHTGVVPRLGGVAFVPAILVAYGLMSGLCVWSGGSMSGELDSIQLSFGLCSVILLYFEGIMDDLVGLRYRIKFIIQILCAVLIVCSGIWLDDFHGLFGMHEISPWFGMPFTVLLIVFIINAINLIDGIDGLASGLSIVAAFFFGIIFYRVEMWGSAALAFATLGTLLPFFYYNVFGSAERRRKIFMGDTGSQCIGLILAILAVRLSMDEPELSGIEGSIIIAFSMLIVPAFDVIRVMIHRTRRHRNMFQPDNCHVHHKLLRMGLSHKTVMVVILVVAMLFVVMNLLLLRWVDINLILVLDVVIWTGAHLLLSNRIAKREASVRG